MYNSKSKVTELRNIPEGSNFVVHNRGVLSSKFYRFVSYCFNMCYCISDTQDVKYISPNTLVQPLNVEL